VVARRWAVELMERAKVVARKRLVECKVLLLSVSFGVPLLESEFPSYPTHTPAPLPSEEGTP